MEERYLLACTRYVELNPVRAGLVKRAEQWPWSSARAHMGGRDDRLVFAAPLLSRVSKSWERFLAQDADEAQIGLFRKHERTDRPLGGDVFYEKL